MASAFPLFAGEPRPPETATNVAPAKEVTAEPGTSWLAANWPDPDKRIAKVDFDGAPVSAIADFLRDQFKDRFDVLVPSGPVAPGMGDYETVTVPLKLRNVTATEIFGAMNHLFSAEAMPLEWRLLMNGSRPTAVLRKVEAPAAAQQAAENAQQKREVVYVGDFTSSTWPVTKIAETLTEIVRADGPTTAVASKAFEVKLHQPADIIVLSGTAAQIVFADQTLTALRQQATRDLRRQTPVAVLGQVNRPGEVAWPQDGKITIVDVISRVGGFTKLAKRAQIQLTRKGQAQTFNWKDLVETKDPDKMIWLQPGDVINVPETTF